MIFENITNSQKRKEKFSLFFLFFRRVGCEMKSLQTSLIFLVLIFGVKPFKPALLPAVQVDSSSFVDSGAFISQITWPATGA